MPNTLVAVPPCPKCGGAMWDNRLTKRNPKAPDYKCKDATCDGAVWPPKNGAAPYAAHAVQPHPTGAKPSTAKQAYSAGPPLPYEVEAAGFTDALPQEKLDHLFQIYALVESHVLATSVPKWTKADVGTTPESVAAQIATIFIQATKPGV